MRNDKIKELVPFTTSDGYMVQRLPLSEKQKNKTGIYDTVYIEFEIMKCPNGKTPKEKYIVVPLRNDNWILSIDNCIKNTIFTFETVQ